MANRQPGPGGKNMSKTGKPNQFGLKEAYSVLQREFLDLKTAYIGNEQQLVKIQEQYMILQQSYQELQSESQNQQAKLVEKVEKSYDAYNEKFMKVEELEEELNRYKKIIEERNENQENIASMQDQLDEMNFQRQLFKEAVEKSLSNVGLSLSIVNDTVEIRISDFKKLGQLKGCDIGRNCTALKNEKATDLENANIFLRPTLLSLQNVSDKQRSELSVATDNLRKKTEECLHLRNDIVGQSVKSAILVERKSVENIVNGLKEMSNFVVELKKTICDQNSWIDMLMSALNENKKSSRSGHDSGRTAEKNIWLKHRLPLLNTPKRSDNSNFQDKSGNASTKKLKKKTKKPGKQVKAANRCPGAGDTEGHSGDIMGHVGVSRHSDEEEVLGEYGDYIVVASAKEHRTIEHIRANNVDGHRFASSHLSWESDTSVPVCNINSRRSLESQLPQMSLMGMDDSRKTLKHFETDSADDISQGSFKGRSKQVGGTEDMCPICNVVFEANCKLAKRRAHINSHFKD